MILLHNEARKQFDRGTKVRELYAKREFPNTIEYSSKCQRRFAQDRDKREQLVNAKGELPKNN